MLVACTVLMLAIALLRMMRSIPNEIGKIVSGLMLLLCSITGLYLAHWLIKLAVVTILLVLPTCIRTHQTQHQYCPSLCLARRGCIQAHPDCAQHPSSQSFTTHYVIKTKETV